jgi:hypothetical protein
MASPSHEKPSGQVAAWPATAPLPAPAAAVSPSPFEPPPAPLLPLLPTFPRPPLLGLPVLWLPVLWLPVLWLPVLGLLACVPLWLDAAREPLVPPVWLVALPGWPPTLLPVLFPLPLLLEPLAMAEPAQE